VGLRRAAAEERLRLSLLNTTVLQFLGGKADGEALQISKTAYGTHNGAKVSRFDVRNASGMMVSLIKCVGSAVQCLTCTPQPCIMKPPACAPLSYGATIASLRTPDSSGHTEEVTLQYDSLDQIREKSPYYGCTIGRMANRIKEGTFSLDGQVSLVLRELVFLTCATSSDSSLL
jgi:hypothetical protein